MSMSRLAFAAVCIVCGAAVPSPAQDLPLRNPFGGDLTEGLDELLETPSGEKADAAPPPAEAAGPVDQLLGMMQQAAEQLNAGVTGRSTQQVQRSIVNQLDSWLGSDGTQGRSSGSQTQAAQQQSAEQQSAEQQSDPSAAGDGQAGVDQERQEPGEQPGEDAGDGAAGGESAAASPAESGPGEGDSVGNSGTNPRPGNAAPVDPAPSGSMAASGEVWGHLPPRVRDRVRNVSPEDYLPQYRSAIEEYFKRIAEQGR